jgi:hypothetical protein
MGQQRTALLDSDGRSCACKGGAGWAVLQRQPRRVTAGREHRIQDLTASQLDFAAALLDPALPIPASIKHAGSEAIRRRFGVYRNNVVASLVSALKLSRHEPARWRRILLVHGARVRQDSASPFADPAALWGIVS